MVFRTVSRFLDVEPNDESALTLAAPPDSFPGGRLVGRDNLGLLASFGDWRLPIGELNARSTARDFDQYIRLTGRPAGEPRLTPGARHFSQLLRVNPVEGVFTGLGATYRFGDAAPGLLARAHAAYLQWREVSVEEKVRLFRSFIDVYGKYADEFARLATLEMGKPIGQSQLEAGIVTQMFGYYADKGPELLKDEAVTVPGFGQAFTRRESVGVVLGIEPWNGPMFQAMRASSK